MTDHHTATMAQAAMYSSSWNTQTWSSREEARGGARRRSPPRGQGAARRPGVHDRPWTRRAARPDDAVDADEAPGERRPRVLRVRRRLLLCRGDGCNERRGSAPLRPGPAAPHSQGDSVQCALAPSSQAEQWCSRPKIRTCTSSAQKDTLPPFPEDLIRAGPTGRRTSSGEANAPVSDDEYDDLVILNTSLKSLLNPTRFNKSTSLTKPPGAYVVDTPQSPPNFVNSDDKQLPNQFEKDQTTSYVESSSTNDAVQPICCQKDRPRPDSSGKVPSCVIALEEENSNAPSSLEISDSPLNACLQVPVARTGSIVCSPPAAARTNAPVKETTPSRVALSSRDISLTHCKPKKKLSLCSVEAESSKPQVDAVAVRVDRALSTEKNHKKYSIFSESPLSLPCNNFLLRKSPVYTQTKSAIEAIKAALFSRNYVQDRPSSPRNSRHARPTVRLREETAALLTASTPSGIKENIFKKDETSLEPSPSQFLASNPPAIDLILENVDGLRRQKLSKPSVWKIAPDLLSGRKCVCTNRGAAQREGRRDGDAERALLPERLVKEPESTADALLHEEPTRLAAASSSAPSVAARAAPAHAAALRARSAAVRGAVGEASAALSDKAAATRRPAAAASRRCACAVRGILSAAAGDDVLAAARTRVDLALCNRTQCARGCDRSGAVCATVSAHGASAPSERSQESDRPVAVYSKKRGAAVSVAVATACDDMEPQTPVSRHGPTPDRNDSTARVRSLFDPTEPRTVEGQVAPYKYEAEGPAECGRRTCPGSPQSVASPPDHAFEPLAASTPIAQRGRPVQRGVPPSEAPPVYDDVSYWVQSGRRAPSYEQPNETPPPAYGQWTPNSSPVQPKVEQSLPPSPQRYLDTEFPPYIPDTKPGMQSSVSRAPWRAGTPSLVVDRSGGVEMAHLVTPWMPPPDPWCMRDIETCRKCCGASREETLPHRGSTTRSTQTKRGLFENLLTEEAGTPESKDRDSYSSVESLLEKLRAQLREELPEKASNHTVPKTQKLSTVDENETPLPCANGHAARAAPAREAPSKPQEKPAHSLDVAPLPSKTATTQPGADAASEAGAPVAAGMPKTQGPSSPDSTPEIVFAPSTELISVTSSDTSLTPSDVEEEKSVKKKKKKAEDAQLVPSPSRTSGSSTSEPLRLREP